VGPGLRATASRPEVLREATSFSKRVIVIFYLIFVD
jgi:hypothetical protein